jgi:TPR repeat protein
MSGRSSTSNSWTRAAFAAAVVLLLSLAASRMPEIGPSGPVAAGPLEDAKAAYDRDEYATALRLLRPLADQGDDVAQYYLGLMHSNGQGVPQDYAEALKWFRRAADRGNIDAQINLGIKYALGWEGVPKNYAESAKWHRLAADRGNHWAQYILGLVYASGVGVPQDYALAYMWFNVSAAQGHPDAARDRDNIAKRMTPAQIADAQKLAREWQPKRR